VDGNGGLFDHNVAHEHLCVGYARGLADGLLTDGRPMLKDTDTEHLIRSFVDYVVDNPKQMEAPHFAQVMVTGWVRDGIFAKR